MSTRSERASIIQRLDGVVLNDPLWLNEPAPGVERYTEFDLADSPEAQAYDMAVRMANRDQANAHLMSEVQEVTYDIRKFRADITTIVRANAGTPRAPDRWVTPRRGQ